GLAMTKQLIALETRISPAAERENLERLRSVLPEETILPLRDIPEADRKYIDIAIDADPDPAALAGLPELRWIHSLWAGVERLVVDLAHLHIPVVRLIDPELARTMAEAVLAWTFYLFRDMPAYARQQRQ